MSTTNNTSGGPEGQEAAFSKECPSLLNHHFDQLCIGSGISVDIIQARGYRSVLEKKELVALGFSRAQQQVPGTLIPLHGPDGSSARYQYKPDNPRTNSKGKPIKYENFPRSLSE
jgi:hypothetical protein